MLNVSRVEPTNEEMEAVRIWLKNQPHLPDYMDDRILRKFIYCCRHSVEVTKTTLDMYYTIRSNSPEMFDNRNPLDPAIQQVFETADFLPLPKLTKENYRLLYYRLIDHDPDHFLFNNCVKTFFMVADVRLLSEDKLVEGEIPIFDMMGFSLKHLSRVVFSTMRKYMQYSQEAQPVTLRQIHVINTPKFIHKIFSLVKPLTKEEVLAVVHFHAIGSTTLTDFVSKDLLPNELGGNLGPMADMKKYWVTKVKDHKDFLMDEKLWKVNESLRPQENNNTASALVGTFKSLMID